MFKNVNRTPYHLVKTKQGCLKSLSGFQKKLTDWKMQPARLLHTSPR